jgi:hypothetical protein
MLKKTFFLQVDLYNAGGQESGSAISGIFIKNVLPNSPAGKTGQLKVFLIALI